MGSVAGWEWDVGREDGAAEAPLPVGAAAGVAESEGFVALLDLGGDEEVALHAADGVALDGDGVTFADEETVVLQVTGWGEADEFRLAGGLEAQLDHGGTGGRPWKVDDLDDFAFQGLDRRPSPTARAGPHGGIGTAVGAAVAGMVMMAAALSEGGCGGEKREGYDCSDGGQESHPFPFPGITGLLSSICT